MTADEVLTQHAAAQCTSAQIHCVWLCALSRCSWFWPVMELAWCVLCPRQTHSAVVVLRFVPPSHCAQCCCVPCSVPPRSVDPVVSLPCSSSCHLLRLFTGTAVAPILWYKFDEASGSTVLDWSGNQYHGGRWSCACCALSLAWLLRMFLPRFEVLCLMRGLRASCRLRCSQRALSACRQVSVQPSSSVPSSNAI